MGMRLIGQDMACTIADGGAYNPAGPAFGGAIDVHAFAKTIRVNDKANTASTRALGDGRERVRPLYAESEIILELLVEYAGRVNIPVGDYIQVKVKGHVLDADYFTYVGVLVENDGNFPDGPTVQTMTIKCDADNA